MAIKGSVLIVEEDQVFREELKRLLLENYQVIEAASVEETLSIAELHQPDLIIMDGDMPDRNGIKVCSELKSGVTTGRSGRAISPPGTGEKSL